MNDKEFIKYLCLQIWNLATDGDEPDIVKISEELENRGINPDELFIY